MSSKVNNAKRKTKHRRLATHLLKAVKLRAVDGVMPDRAQWHFVVGQGMLADISRIDHALVSGTFFQRLYIYGYSVDVDFSRPSDYLSFEESDN